MIDWKAIPKIDAHIHLMPADVIAANSDCNDPFIENGCVNDYLAVMDENNIECAFMMPFNDPYMLSMDFTVETVHDNLQKMAASVPARFRCFADVDIRRPIGQTLSELERVLKQKAFAGIKLHPTNTGYPIDGEYYDHVFKYANDNGILVEVHSYPREHLRDDVCSPGRLKTVLGRYPDLKLSIAHLGGFQVEEVFGLNAYVNISSVLPDLVNRFGIERANEILRSIGVERLVFATDYPDSRRLKANEIYDQYFAILSKMDFTQEEAERICKYNALQMIQEG